MDYKKIKKAYLNSAILVKIYGDKYLPIFERLHQEMATLNQLQDLKAIALNLAVNHPHRTNCIDT